MGKIACECGYIHSDTCGYDGHLFKYDEWHIYDEIAIDNLEPINVLECPDCGNLMMDDPKDDRMMVSYKPVNGKYNGILTHE